MRYRLLGRSGLRVSEVCLGAMTFGGGTATVKGSDDVESRAVFDAFAEAGGTFIDTACSYSHGASEALLGDLIAADRDTFVVATKYTNHHGGGLSKSGNSRKNMMRSAEESLKRLKTDHLDLFQLHNWDLMTPVDEVMRGFDDLVCSGKTLYVGVSNMPAWEISRANTMADLLGMSPLISIQIEFSLLQREAENEHWPMARALDLGVMAWGPLAAGLLVRAPDAPDARRASLRHVSERQQRLAGAVAEIAGELGATPAQTALAALRQLPGCERVIPIIGASRGRQVTENLKFLDLTLSAEQMARLEAVAPPNLVYPASILRAPGSEMLTTGGRPGVVDRHRP